jgi:deoxyribodipyrimidine photo-lyase
MRSVTLPALDRTEVARWIEIHLADVVSEPVVGSSRFVGGQQAADRALAGFDVAGYATQRNEVLPRTARGASALSPWIRHGMLQLAEVWEAAAGGPARDVRKFRDELLWQEYARHRYARLGSAPWTRDAGVDPAAGEAGTGRGMACLDFIREELHRDGWLVNQTRMWAASHWSVRAGLPWEAGEREMFRHLLDGSRAANGLGWQWTAGVATGKPYGFSRFQVEKRAPELCRTCPHRTSCPIEAWPDAASPGRIDVAGLRSDPDPAGTAGPAEPQVRAPAEAVWITAESLGDADPALAAHPDAPAVFVFDLPLLRRLELSAKRLVFLVETLADLAERRTVEVLLGDPAEVIAGRPLAATFAPVPGWRRRAARLDLVDVRPWPWLIRPHTGSVASFSAWRRAAERGSSRR